MSAPPCRGAPADEVELAQVNEDEKEPEQRILRFDLRQRTGYNSSTVLRRDSLAALTLLVAAASSQCVATADPHRHLEMNRK